MTQLSPPRHHSLMWWLSCGLSRPQCLALPHGNSGCSAERIFPFGAAFPQGQQPVLGVCCPLPWLELSFGCLRGFALWRCPNPAPFPARSPLGWGCPSIGTPSRPRQVWECWGSSGHCQGHLSPLQSLIPWSPGSSQAVGKGWVQGRDGAGPPSPGEAAPQRGWGCWGGREPAESRGRDIFGIEVQDHSRQVGGVINQHFPCTASP